MDNTRATMTCLNCERSVEQVPLLTVTHRDGLAYICPQCLPILIHEPHTLADKLAGADALRPHEH